MGRPVKYTEEFCQKLGNKLLAWMEADEKNIFVKQFLIEQKDWMDEARISELVKKYATFSQLIKKAKAIQEMRLANIALNTGKPIGAIFLLKNHHNYADKQEIKTDNINRNLDRKDVAAATDEQLKDMLRTMTEGKPVE